MDSIFTVDGSLLEGGGQILRMSAVFSVLLRKPIRVQNIRAGRSTPGLRPQHLSGLQLMRDLCNGELDGGSVSSTEIKFTPSDLDGGSFCADTKTAGSTCLLLQVSLPCLLFGKTPSELVLRGGTNADMAPQIDYLIEVFSPLAKRMGINFDCDIVKRGYYPKGGGEVRIKVNPLRQITPIELLDRGQVINIHGRAWVAGTLPIKMAHEAANRAEQILKKEYPNIPRKIVAEKESPNKASHPGFGMTIVAETSTGCLMAGDSLGKRGESNSAVGERAAQMLMENLKHGGCVDQHLQDQLIVFMALAKGHSAIRMGPVTLHTETAIYIAGLFTTAKFNTEKQDDGTFIISCDGCGYEPAQV